MDIATGQHIWIRIALAFMALYPCLDSCMDYRLTYLVLYVLTWIMRMVAGLSNMDNLLILIALSLVCAVTSNAWFPLDRQHVAL